MATLSFVTHTLVSNIRHPFKFYTTFYITIIILVHSFNSTFSITIVHPDTDNYLPSDDPNITNLMVSHYDCAKQHNLRQFNLLNVKQCTEAPSDIKHASVKARVYVRAKAKRIKAFKCVAYAKKERKICFQGSVKYRRVDRTVWNHNTLPLPVTLDPLECKNIIRHLHGTNDKILNNFNYNKTFTLLEDHYFQERLEQYQTPFTVYQLNKMYTGTFTFMPADKNWIYDPTKNPYHNCPAHHQFEVNLVSWRLEISEIELTYDDTSNDMIIDGHTLPCYFADGFCKPTTKTPFTLVWFNDDYCVIVTLQDFIGRMTKIEDRYWIETDSFVHSPHSVKSQTASGIKGTKHPYVHAPHTQHPNNPSLSRFEVFPTAQTFCGKPDPLYSTQYSDLFVTYTDGFNMHTGQPNPHSIIDEYISGKIVLDTSNNKFVFPALNVSNNFATIDYDAHINTKIDYTINHVFRSMTVQELNTLHTICEIERNQLLTILAMSVQNPQLAGFLLTGNRSNFLYVEGSTAWLYDCPHFLSPLYKADRCFDRIPIHFKDTLMYVDPITRQTYDYATPITCDNNPRNIIELDPDSDDQDFYILGPEPIKRKPPLMFTPSQIKTTIRPNTFTAQDAGIYSNAELDQFWNRILFSKHSDSTLQLLGKALSYSFISSNTPNYDADSPQNSGNPYNTLRIGLHDKLLNLTPLFTPTLFSDAFIALFGYPCYILTQCGIYFSTFLFVQATLTLIVKLYKTISIKYNLKNKITLFSSIAHGFFNVLTARMVSDLHEAQNKKPKSTLSKSKSLDNFIDTSPNLINHSTDVTSPPPFYTKRSNKIQFPKFNFFPKRHHNSHHKTTPLPFSSVQHPPLPNYTHKNFHPNDNLTTQHDTFINNSVTSTTDTPIKIYSRINYPFPPPSS